MFYEHLGSLINWFLSRTGSGVSREQMISDLERMAAALRSGA